MNISVTVTVFSRRCVGISYCNVTPLFLQDFIFSEYKYVIISSPMVGGRKKHRNSEFHKSAFRKVLLSGKKNEPKPKLFGPDILGGGPSTWRGGGRKVRYVLRNPGNQNFMGGISRDFGRDIPGAPEKFEKKKSGFNFRPVNFWKGGKGPPPPRFQPY